MLHSAHLMQYAPNTSFNLLEPKLLKDLPSCGTSALMPIHAGNSKKNPETNFIHDQAHILVNQEITLIMGLTLTIN